jgi:hypothetical protein
VSRNSAPRLTPNNIHFSRLRKRAAMIVTRGILGRGAAAVGSLFTCPSAVARRVWQACRRGRFSRP